MDYQTHLNNAKVQGDSAHKNLNTFAGVPFEDDELLKLAQLQASLAIYHALMAIAKRQKWVQ